MSYMALYRKWRPDTFDEVKGQEHVVTTLKNQIKNDRIGHAFLFCGTRGTGKTSIAKLFAKAVNCENPVDGSPCNKCASCIAISKGTAMNVIEIDAASNNGVDNIRQIKEEIEYSPSEGKYKVYIIDEVHMLSPGAFNALLKTLEEPPSYVIFILATTEAHKIPITISSRCQKYDFRRIPATTISDRLMELMDREKIDVEQKAVEYIAKAADGSMRDALSILDQCIAFNLGSRLTYDNVIDTIGAVDIDIFVKLFDRILELDVAGAIDVIGEIVWQGRELSRFVSEFTWFMRNILLVKVSAEGDNNLDMSTENIEKIKNLAERTDLDALLRYIRIFSETGANIKYATQKRVVLELTIIKLCRPEMETDYSSILDRIRILEKKVEEVQPTSGGVNVSEDVMKQLYDKLQSQDAVRAVQSIYDDKGQYTVAKSKEVASRVKGELKEASYRNLMEIVDCWHEIVAAHTPLTRGNLEAAKLNINENRDGLYLTVIQGEDTARVINYFSDKDKIADLTEELQEIAERRIKLEFRLLKENTEEASEALDMDLSKINMEVIREW